MSECQRDRAPAAAHHRQHQEKRMTHDDDDRPVILNPEAVGSPDLTPEVQLPHGMADWFERTRCPECGQINRTHADECSVGAEVSQ